MKTGVAIEYAILFYVPEIALFFENTQIPCKIYFGGNKRYNKDLLKKELKNKA